MLTSFDRIDDCLEQYPRGICDDCLSVCASVKPRQQTNQICRRLAISKIIQRDQGVCSVCSKQKLINAPGEYLRDAPDVLKKGDTSVKGTAPSIKDVPAHLDQIRREIVQMLNSLDKQLNRAEGLSGRIARLRESGKLPSSIACMMLTLNSLRNLVVYESFTPGRNEQIVIAAAWAAVREWRES